MRQINMFSFGALLVATGAAAGGCGSETTADPVPGMGGSTPTVTAGGGTGGTTGSSSAVDRFAGTWRYVSGTSTTVCGGASQTTVTSGTLQLSKGIDSDLVQVDDACSIKFNLSGTTASVVDNQTCFVANGANSVEVRYRAWSFTTTDGHTMNENGSASLTYETDTGRVTCDFTVSANLTKAAQ